MRRKNYEVAVVCRGPPAHHRGVYFLFTYLFTCLFIYLLIYLCIYSFIYLLAHLFIYLLIYVFTHLFIYLFIYLFIRILKIDPILSSLNKYQPPRDRPQKTALFQIIGF